MPSISRSAPSVDRAGGGCRGGIPSTATRDLRAIWTGAILTTGTLGTIGVLVLLGPDRDPLRYRTGRTAGSGFALVIFGAVFLASGGFAGRSAISGFGSVFEAVFSLVGLLFLGVFGLVGVALVVFGIWRIANGLRVEATPRTIRVTRRFALLLARSREWPTKEVERIEAVPVGQYGDVARATVEYAVRGTTRNGPRIPLGDGIRGPFRMERVVTYLERATGLPVEVLTRDESKRRRKGAGRPVRARVPTGARDDGRAD